jgi:hypothetical protein
MYSFLFLCFLDNIGIEKCRDGDEDQRHSTRITVWKHSTYRVRIENPLSIFPKHPSFYFKPTSYMVAIVQNTFSFCLFVWWCLMPLLTIFQLYHGGQFLLMEETGVPVENHRPVASNWQTLSHNVVSSTLRHERGSNSTVVVIGTDCTGSCKSNYHTIMARISD